MARTWIFQASPEVFDLRGALASLRDQTWSVRQHRDEIAAGDTAYLWISGTEGGLAARATVVTSPARGRMHAEELPFILDHGHLGDEEDRVEIRVERALAKPISRDAIASDPVLQSTELIRKVRGTNFAVTEAEAARFAELFDASIAAPLPTAIEAQGGNRARSPEMWLAGYFLSRCGQRRAHDVGPPPQLEVENWYEAYRRFYPTLAGGRSPQVFVNSLKNARDDYDAHLDSGRVGWRDGLTPNRPPGRLSPLARETMDRWQDRSCEELWEAVRPFTEPVAATSADARTIEQLADELCLTADFAREMEWLLGDRQQLVFYGPPGTGKTYVAQEFARWFAGSPDRVMTIQFHASYAYEDFVEGIRPVLDVDELRYRLTPGLLRRFAARAADDRDHRYVLVIDEVNRANLARVFGELLYLLEYRKETITLPYSGIDFGIPPKLYFIGTMNTADRSIALVDFALRRRFHFVEFAADPAILRRWLSKHNKPMESVADLLAWVNREINARDFAIGFSYFMRGDLDEAILARIWERSILPALDEYFFDSPEKRKRFELPAVRAAVAREVAGQPSPGLANTEEILSEERPAEAS